MDKKTCFALISVLLLAFSSMAAGSIPTVTASVFSGGSWLRATDSDWSSGKSKSDIRRLAEEAQDGDVDAMRQLGIMSMKGQKVKKSTKIAIQWWKKAADEGDGRSMMYLGDVYGSGNGVRKDERLALKYYEDALKTAGDEADEVTDDDNIVIKRIKKLPLRTTLRWWEKRCSQGDTHAMYYLATLKKKHREGVLDDEKAAEYLVHAAKAGHAKARKKIEKAPKEQYPAYWEAAEEQEEPVPATENEENENTQDAEEGEDEEDTETSTRKMLAQQGITPNLYNALMFEAYEQQDFALVDLLLKAGANPETLHRKGYTLLQKAAYDGNVYIAECLLHAGASSIGTGNAGAPPLNIALSSEAPNPRMIHLLLETGAKPDDLAYNSAICKNNALIVRMLLKAGGKPSGTHLSTAVSGGHAGIVRLLLQAGINPNFRDSEKKTALNIAEEKGFTEIADMLRKAGGRAFVPPDASVQNKAKKKLLELGITEGDYNLELMKKTMDRDYETAELLLQAGADANCRLWNGKSNALHFSTISKDTKMMALLLRYGADYNSRLCENIPETPLMIALQEKISDCIDSTEKVMELLLKAGADTEVRGGKNFTVLHKAIAENHVPAVRILLAAGANIHATYNNLTMLELAQKAHATEEIRQLLIKAGAK